MNLEQLRSLGIFTIISTRQMVLIKDLISSVENTIYHTGKTRVHIDRQPSAEEERYLKLYFAFQDMEIVGPYEKSPKEGYFMYVEHVIERDYIHCMGASPYITK